VRLRGIVEWLCSVDGIKECGSVQSIILKYKVRRIKSRTLWVGGTDAVFNRPENSQNPTKKHRFWGPKKVPAGSPGRGVLRFLRPGYRNPVHILGFFRVFSEKRQT